MKQRLKPAGIGIAFLGIIAAGNAQELLTFDDLPTTPPGPGQAGVGIIPNGYGGLDWNNFGVINGSQVETTYGYYDGVVSPPNVAFNEYGNPASITSPGETFDLGSADLTAALNLSTPLNIEVQGFAGSAMLYDNTYTVDNTGPTLIDFNYEGVDSVTFTSSPSQQFAMDGLTVTIVPEPGTWSILLAGVGLIGFAARRRRSFVR
jgi:hypothetical protein